MHLEIGFYHFGDLILGNTYLIMSHSTMAPLLRLFLKPLGEFCKNGIYVLIAYSIFFACFFAPNVRLCLFPSR